MSEERDLAKKFAQEYAALVMRKGDKMGLTDVRLLVEQLTQKSEKSLYEKILAIAVKIHHLKDEFAHIDTDKIAEKDLASANTRLEAVVRATENATHNILDAASEIQAQLDGIDAKKSAVIMDKITKIFEACNFQDLTGQHINNVVKTLVDVEGLIKAIIKVLPEDFKQSVKESTLHPEDPKNLLQGPQLASEAPTQDDIDKIFAES